jgi:hypothetical protein
MNVDDESRWTLHNDLKERSFEIKLAFIKKGWDFHPISH